MNTQTFETLAKLTQGNRSVVIPTVVDGKSVLLHITLLADEQKPVHVAQVKPAACTGVTPVVKMSRQFDTHTWWSAAEDETLIRNYGKMPYRAMLDMLPGRTYSAISSRALVLQANGKLVQQPRSVIPKQVSTAWTAEEDRMLCQVVHRDGRNWRAVAAMFPLRTKGACSARYFYLRRTKPEAFQQVTTTTTVTVTR